jgi:hypothetical protein
MPFLTTLLVTPRPFTPDHTLHTPLGAGGMAPLSVNDYPLWAPLPLGSPPVSPLTLGIRRPVVGGDAANKFSAHFLV